MKLFQKQILIFDQILGVKKDQKLSALAHFFLVVVVEMAVSQSIWWGHLCEFVFGGQLCATETSTNFARCTSIPQGDWGRWDLAILAAFGCYAWSVKVHLHYTSLTGTTLFRWFCCWDHVDLQFCCWGLWVLVIFSL